MGVIINSECAIYYNRYVSEIKDNTRSLEYDDVLLKHLPTYIYKYLPYINKMVVHYAKTLSFRISRTTMRVLRKSIGQCINTK